MSNLKNIFVILGVVSIFALHPSLNKNGSPISYLQYLVYGNSLDVSCCNSIDINDIQIKWVCETQTALCNDLIVFEKGIQVNDIPFEKGQQQLLVFYKGNKIGELDQNKITSKQAHQYQINILSNNNSLFFNGEIVGPASYTSPARTIAYLGSL